jgi:hypothetical protein
MSEIILDTITGKSTATTITIGSTPVVSASANSMTIRGEGSNQTSIQQGLCKQWIHFNGSGTIAIVGSFNTTSITDNGVGDYQVTIANDMGNDDYSVSGTMCYPTTGNSSAARQGPAVNEHAVGSYQVYAGSNTTTLEDVAVINLQTMGDLA